MLIREVINEFTHLLHSFASIGNMDEIKLCLREFEKFLGPQITQTQYVPQNLCILSSFQTRASCPKRKQSYTRFKEVGFVTGSNQNEYSTLVMVMVLVCENFEDIKPKKFQGNNVQTYGGVVVKRRLTYEF